MNNINEIEIFKNNKNTLKNLSCDKNEYMTDSLLEAINFDKVKEKHCKSLKLSNLPTSCDALYQNDEIFFIEFKNGYIDKKEICGIHKKIYDSILIFMDLTKFKLEEIREKVNFILVYNETKSQEETKKIETPASYNNIIYRMGQLGGNISKFKLNQFEKYLVKNTYTYTKKEFEDYFINKQTTP